MELNLIFNKLFSECNHTCLKCKSDTSQFGSNNCKTCHPLSENYNKKPTGGSCGKRKYFI